MANHLQHLINFASNIPIYQHYCDGNYGYSLEDYNKVNNTKELDDPQYATDELNNYVSLEFADLSFICTKSVCGLTYNDSDDNNDDDDILLTFTTESMINVIVSNPVNNRAIGITLYTFDNKLFVDILSSIGQFITNLSVDFGVTQDGTEVICCIFESDFDVGNYEIIVYIELAHYTVFQKYVSQLTNIDQICMNASANKDSSYIEYSITPTTNLITQAVIGIAQIKSAKHLVIRKTKDLAILDVILDCFKNSNIEYLFTRTSNKNTYKLIDTLKLKSLNLASIGKDTRKHISMANSIINNRTLQSFSANIVDNNESEILYKAINDSTILDVNLTFWDSDDIFINFCKLAPFKRNFKVISLNEISMGNIKYLSYLLNGSYYVDQLNIHINGAFVSYNEDIHNLTSIIDHLDNCITIGNINFHDDENELMENMLDEKVTNILTNKLQINKVRRTTIRCTLLLHKIKDNLVATLPKCLLMYLVRNYF